MTIPVILNEASYQAWPDDACAANECIMRVGEALGGLGRLGRSVFLLSDEAIGSISFGQRSLREFLSDGAVRDAIRTLLTFASKSPLGSFGELDADGAECFVGNSRSRGVLYAYLLRTVAVSFPVSEWCDGERINARLRELAADGDQLYDRDVVAANVARADHVAIHAPWLLEFRQAEPTTGDELWAALGDWFPNLRFLTRVEADLGRLPNASLALAQVVDRLFELEATARDWRGGQQLAWRSHITRESATRRSLCDFVAADGSTKNYELHARYTPGAGRIHFRIVPDDRRFEIAYIGTKLT